MINIKDVESKIKDIQKRIELESIDEKRNYLIYDYLSLVNLLSLLNKSNFKKYNKVYDVNFRKMCEPFYEESLESIITNRNKIYSIMGRSEHLNYTHPKIYFGKKYHYNDYEILLNDFWHTFNKNVIHDYNNLKNNNIYIGQYDDSSRGCYYNIHNYNSSYILLKEKNPSLLSHELTHDIEFKDIHDFKTTLNYRHSTFKELLPRFIEYTFLNNIKEEKYGYYKYGELFDYYDGIKCSSEYLIEIIKKIDKYDSRHNLMYDNKTINKYSIDLLICDVLAIYLYHLYMHDKKEFDSIIIKIRNIRGISDDKIWKLFNINDVIDTLKVETINFNKSISLNKKLNK